MDREALTALSPPDGRYVSYTRELRDFFSEWAYIRYRLMVEVEYLIFLTEDTPLTPVKLSPEQTKRLRAIYENFSGEDALQIKETEAQLQHDVKAIEVWLGRRLQAFGLGKLVPFAHFALTSQDVNNTALSLMVRDAQQRVLFPAVGRLLHQLIEICKEHANTPILARTHGQPASPTTFGKEMAVHAERLAQEVQHLTGIQLTAKLGGATGTLATFVLASPTLDWQALLDAFARKLGLKREPCTTQISTYSALSALLDGWRRVAVILLDMAQDMWLYCMNGIVKLRSPRQEVGSSVMPHKVNPRHFETAEGNLKLAIALLEALSRHLPVSRLQRDLSDSTLTRNTGLAFGYLLTAIHYIREGLSRITVDTDAARQELDQHWEVLAEAIQTLLRLEGDPTAYERIKHLTKGTRLTREEYKRLVENIEGLSPQNRKKLLSLTPHTYTGIAEAIARETIGRIYPLVQQLTQAPKK